MTYDEVLDRIEREVHIGAPAEVVWELVSQPGWWINDGEVVPHRVEEREDHVVVHHPTHGSFAIRTVSSVPPRHVAYRWLGDDDGQGTTLVEFWIADVGDGVVLKVVESGFASLPGTLEQRRRLRQDNAEGWDTELAAALGHCAPTAAFGASGS